MTTYLVEVISVSPIGPRAWSFWVLMPISAPNPNSPPSVNRVDALTITAAESTAAVKRRELVREAAQGLQLPIWNALSFFTIYANLDGWAPRAYDTEAHCMDRKVYAEKQCLLYPLEYEALWVCNKGEPAKGPPQKLIPVDC